MFKVEADFQPVNENTWKKDLFAWNKSPIDLSFLNHKPAGKFGPVSVKGDKFEFADGRQAKFWGVNLQASALFQTTHKNIKIQAKRMASLGINLVRFHHHDSVWVKPNVFNDKDNNTLRLNSKSMQQLDFWITALKNEGIYIWLDLHVGRIFKEGDNIFAMKEISGKVKYFSYLNASIKERLIEFQKLYLTHKNTLTGIEYRNEPAIMGLLLTNENDVTNHGGNQFLKDKKVPEHTKLFDKDRKIFTSKTGLSLLKTSQTWLPGESKLYLNDLEHRFNMQMIEQLKTLGVEKPMATTNLWGRAAAFSLPALADGSIIDTHAYVKGDEFKKNPRFTEGFLTQVSLGAISNKVVTISEWNVRSDRVPHRFNMPLYTAAIASLQGWDAAMIYGYGQVPLNQASKLRNWSSFNDPALMGIMPAAALLFRRGHVAKAKQNYLLKLDRESIFFKSVKGSTSKSIRTLLETHRFTIGMPKTKELPWLKETKVPEGTIVINDLDIDFIPVDQNYVESDTAELRRDWSKGIHTINTKYSQSASGWIGGDEIQLDDIKVKIQTSNAVAIVQSLDDDPISASDSLLITISAQVATTKSAQTVVLSEPVIGTIFIRSKAGKKLYPLKSDGTVLAEIKTAYLDGHYIVELKDDMPSHWLILKQQ